MRDIDNYTKDAINSRLNWAQSPWQYSRQENDGVVHISFYVGYSIGVPFIPIAGTIGGLIGTAMNDWQHYYFNADTGEMISESRANDLRKQTRNNNEANSLNGQGLELWNQGKYAEAAEKFSAAYNKCTSGYSSEQNFKDNMNHAKAQVLNNEGNKLHNEKKYSEAINKYQQAYNTCPDSKNRDTYKNNEANSLNGQGLELWNQGKYAEAAEKFSTAYNKCTSGYSSEQNFKDNMNHAKAQVLNNEGNKLHNEKKYSEAINKYQQAYNTVRAAIIPRLKWYMILRSRKIQL